MITARAAIALHTETAGAPRKSLVGPLKKSVLEFYAIVACSAWPAAAGPAWAGDGAGKLARNWVRRRMARTAAASRLRLTAAAVR